MLTIFSIAFLAMTLLFLIEADRGRKMGGKISNLQRHLSDAQERVRVLEAGQSRDARTITQYHRAYEILNRVLAQSPEALATHRRVLDQLAAEEFIEDLRKQGINQRGDRHDNAPRQH